MLLHVACSQQFTKQRKLYQLHDVNERAFCRAAQRDVPGGAGPGAASERCPAWLPCAPAGSACTGGALVHALCRSSAA